MKKKFEELNTKLDSLVIFNNLLTAPAMAAFRELLCTFEVKAYSQFVSKLYSETSDFSVYVRTLLLNDDNFYIKQKAAGHLISPVVNRCLKEELSTLEALSHVTSADIKQVVGYKEFLPDWENTVFDFYYAYQEKLQSLTSTGYGIFAKHTVFRLEGEQLAPVKYPDSQQLDHLFGYQRERNLIIKNTEALLSGTGASNMLLYGDAGTGKSSTIKAVCNHYAKDGLRLIEIKKHQLHKLPFILEELSSNPLKFVIYIDDLSFASSDDNFSALKAILEGSVSSCGDNIAVYATSNRRHLVKESMSDREGDELHLSDTLQETMSLAARFGLTITYLRPEKDQYLEIVKQLAKQYALDIEEEDLLKQAEIHALRANGRTPRAAKQFIELLKIGM